MKFPGAEIMELLSPAGNLETALAAFDGGADAVYCGLGKFNARERAENFTPETLGKLLEFARINDKKVYLTLNTLVWENELGELFEQLLEIDKLRPHALIVQDPGVAAIVNRYFPQMPLHASTQMGIHNSSGVKLAAGLGFKRVILERQISLEELRLLAKSSPLELEVFLHGSLCCSLSGRCLLSHYLYGESGNRGRCKQPCRRTFKRGNDHLHILSPADLAGASLLEELKKIGIASLKIEGRLRSPDYIWKTARAYRLLLDNPGNADAASEAAAIFKSVPSRRKSQGFYFKSDWKKLISPAESGAFGECSAVVEKAIRSGIMVKVITGLHLGDRLRLMPPAGGDGESFSLISMEDRKRNKLIRAKAGETVFISGSFRADPGYEIRRIGENGFDFSRRASSLPLYRRGIGIKLNISEKLWCGSVDGIKIKWQCRTDFSAARNQPLSAEKVREVFSAGLPDGYFVHSADVHIEGGFFVPAGELKNLRRSFWDFFATELQQYDFFKDHPAKMENFFQAAASPQKDINTPFTLSDDHLVIPPFIPEDALPLWKQKISAAFNSGTKDFVVTHWHGFELLKKLTGIRILVRYPFHLSNQFAVKLAQSLGADAGESSPEMPESSRQLLQQRSPLPLLMPTASYPLLASRLPLIPGNCSCGGKNFKIIRDAEISLLLPVVD
ncbi:MAG: U32 family peptidase [Lentisphaerae bacterium]|nr:U32 family peptidase [Lentisphaerota bacterium]